MGRVLLAIAILTFVVTLGAADANAGPKDYNHYFNWLRDADGDGIPNCLDEDWVRPGDGTGFQMGNAFGQLFSFGPALNGSQNRNKNGSGGNLDSPGDKVRQQLRKRDKTCTQ